MAGITKQFVSVRILVLEVAELCFCRLILEASYWGLNVQGKERIADTVNSGSQVLRVTLPLFSVSLTGIFIALSWRISQLSFESSDPVNSSLGSN